MGDFAPRGTFTALVTPFEKDGVAIDWPSFDRHVEAQIDAGLEGVVPVGTTGESPTLTYPEQGEVIRRTVELCRGRTQVLAGVGSNDTRDVLALIRAAEKAGADAAMVVMPYYNRPDQRGLLEHIKAVVAVSALPIVLYNVPGRTAVSLTAETTLRILDACPTVVAVKDASGDPHYCQQLLSQAGDRVTVLCGDDALTVPLMSLGARGVISVTSNAAPRAVKAVVDDVVAGNWEAARQKHFRLLPMHDAMFLAPSPVPAKTVLNARGLMEKTVRLPLVAAEPELERTIIAAVEALGSSAS
jgi:4-hydroxy-tetrahydrodipicolinate synthase